MSRVFFPMMTSTLARIWNGQRPPVVQLSDGLASRTSVGQNLRTMRHFASSQKSSDSEEFLELVAKLRDLCACSTKLSEMQFNTELIRLIEAILPTALSETEQYTLDQLKLRSLQTMRSRPVTSLTSRLVTNALTRNWQAPIAKQSPAWTRTSFAAARHFSSAQKRVIPLDALQNAVAKIIDGLHGQYERNEITMAQCQRGIIEVVAKLTETRKKLGSIGDNPSLEEVQLMAALTMKWSIDYEHTGVGGRSRPKPRPSSKERFEHFYVKYLLNENGDGLGKETQETLKTLKETGFVNDVDERSVIEALPKVYDELCEIETRCILNLLGTKWAPFLTSPARTAVQQRRGNFPTKSASGKQLK